MTINNTISLVERINNGESIRICKTLVRKARSFHGRFFILSTANFDKTGSLMFDDNYTETHIRVKTVIELKRELRKLVN